MGVFIYDIFLFLFNISIRIAALFNKKARKWVEGRKDIWNSLHDTFRQQQTGGAAVKIIWMHCSSLGEFEQGRPVLELLRKTYPNYRLLLSFFSPSGYEVRKNYAGADWIYYLPMDGRNNTKKFLDIVNPTLVIFVKYEFWYHYLKTIHDRKIPLLLISAIFRKDSAFFKSYGGLQRKMLSFFKHLFVQNNHSKQLLATLGLESACSVTGDTRFDRVIEIANDAGPIKEVEAFIGGQIAIVAGSTWDKDESVLKEAITRLDHLSFKLIIAPHEINKEHLDSLKKLFPGALFFSALPNSSSSPVSNVLIIDNIGMLSRLYQYAKLSYIGGGFGKGIHNTLEAAVFGKPLLFGPAYEKFNEAIELVAAGAAQPVSNAADLEAAIALFLSDNEIYRKASENSRSYVYDNKGATEKILRFIQEKRLLTN